MKAYITLLTAGLLSAALANAQTTNSSTTNSSGTTTNSTNGTTTPATGTYSTTPSTTNSTYSTTPSSTSYGSGNGTSTTGGSLNSSGTTTGGTYSTGGSTTPSTYGTTGTTTTTNTYNTNTKPERTKKDYKNFVFGIYAGLNTTKFMGETTNTSGDLSGRLGYQGGFFVRGGGRLYGQLGAEYFASSSNYFTAGSGQSVSDIQDQIDIQYVQIPAYIGYKLVESDRGISAVRLQIGLEYANRINSNSGEFNLTNSEIKSGTFNGLGQLGFDAGPIFLDLTYHYGFSDSIEGTGFTGSQRRILSASVGFKF